MLDVPCPIEGMRPGPSSMPPGWTVLPGAALVALAESSRPPERRVALLNPTFGLALVDVLPAGAPPLDRDEVEATAARVRRRLDLARFGCIFPGHLPVLHLGLTEAELPRIGAVIEAAFAARAPLDLPAGGAWLPAVARALTTTPVEVPLASAAELRRQGRTRMRHLRQGLGAASALAVALAGVVMLRAPGEEDAPAAPRAGSPIALLSMPIEGLAGMRPAEAAAPGEPKDPAQADATGAEASPGAAPAGAAAAAGGGTGDTPPEAATPTAPVPEPDAPRLGDLARETPAVTPPAPVVATPALPVPEPDAPRRGDLARETPPVAPPAPIVASPMPSPEPARPGAATAPAPTTSAPTATAAAAPAPRRPAQDAALLRVLLTRGEEMLARGDVSGARLMFRRAAEGGSGEAARALARSYDPAVLAGLGVRGIRPDPAEAALWYRRAAELGVN
ncbi:hypothetical protein [Falsiroseomonas sp. CW058]|uniref:hypothetical protein n=1 Tax=Falsiroseomonas sp. CW058 TaxID=3388664 RepID=UPI003D30FD71